MLHLKSHADPHTLRVEDFTPHSHQQTSHLDKTKARSAGANQHHEPDGHNRYLENISPKSKEYTFFSESHGTVSKTEHLLGTQCKSQQIQEN